LKTGYDRIVKSTLRQMTYVLYVTVSIAVCTTMGNPREDATAKGLLCILL